MRKQVIPTQKEIPHDEMEDDNVHTTGNPSTSESYINEQLTLLRTTINEYLKNNDQYME